MHGVEPKLAEWHRLYKELETRVRNCTLRAHDHPLTPGLATWKPKQ